MPTVFDRENASSSATVARTPEWMISFGEKGKELTSSGVDKFDGYVELYGWHSESSRYVSGDVSGALFTSAAVKNSDLIVVLPHGEHEPKLELWMYQGKNIKEVNIVRLGWTEGEIKVFQQIKFKVVRLIEYQQNVQYCVFYAQVQSKNNDITVFKQQDGTASGHKISDINFRENTLSFK